MAKCKKCGQLISWVKTPGDRKMPIDIPACRHLMAVTLDGGLMDPDTRLVVVVRGQPNLGFTLTAGDGEIARLYTPHWATCTDPDQFRKV